MPTDVLAIIPNSVKQLLGCHRDKLAVLRNIDVLDLFSGKARVARWAELVGLTSVPLDREYGSHLDLCTPLGQAVAICTLLRVRRNGLLMMGPQCSSWIWLSRSRTKRSLANVNGDLQVHTVQEGNQVNSFCGLLVAICTLLGLAWIVEQPGSSLFFHTEIMKAMVRHSNAYQRHILMKQYGHTSCKATLLVGVAELLKTMGKELHAKKKSREPARRRKTTSQNKSAKKGPKAKAKAKVSKPLMVDKPSKLAKKEKKKDTKKKTKVTKHTATDTSSQLCYVSTSKTGKRSVTGKPKEVKASQVYPVKFALAVIAGHFPNSVRR